MCVLENRERVCDWECERKGREETEGEGAIEIARLREKEKDGEREGDRERWIERDANSRK